MLSRVSWPYSAYLFRLLYRISGWGATAPNLSNTQRPLSGAICTSLIISGMFFDVTSYNPEGSTTVFPMTAGSQGGFLLATGFDGIAGSAASTASTPTSSGAPSGSATSSASSSATSLAVSCGRLLLCAAFLLLALSVISNPDRL